MKIPAIQMKDGQVGKIVNWPASPRVEGMEVQRVGNALFLSQSSWQDVFHDKSFLHEDDYLVELLA